MHFGLHCRFPAEETLQSSVSILIRLPPLQELCFLKSEPRLFRLEKDLRKLDPKSTWANVHPPRVCEKRNAQEAEMEVLSPVQTGNWCLANKHYQTIAWWPNRIRHVWSPWKRNRIQCVINCLSSFKTLSNTIKPHRTRSKGGGSKQDNVWSPNNVWSCLVANHSLFGHIEFRCPCGVAHSCVLQWEICLRLNYPFCFFFEYHTFIITKLSIHGKKILRELLPSKHAFCPFWTEERTLHISSSEWLFWKKVLFFVWCKINN